MTFFLCSPQQPHQYQPRLLRPHWESPLLHQVLALALAVNLCRSQNLLLLPIAEVPRMSPLPAFPPLSTLPPLRFPHLRNLPFSRPEPRASRSRSSSLVANALSHAVAAAASASVHATVIAEEPGAESPEIIPNGVPEKEITVTPPPVAENSDSDASGSANGSANSFTNFYAHGNNADIQNVGGSNRATPSPNGTPNGSEPNGKGHNSGSASPVPPGGNDAKGDDGFTGMFISW
jgi:hypothetical protein